jgi:hypothetical protein
MGAIIEYKLWRDKGWRMAVKYQDLAKLGSGGNESLGKIAAGVYAEGLGSMDPRTVH